MDKFAVRHLFGEFSAAPTGRHLMNASGLPAQALQFPNKLIKTTIVEIPLDSTIRRRSRNHCSIPVVDQFELSRTQRANFAP